MVGFDFLEWINDICRVVVEMLCMMVIIQDLFSSAEYGQRHRI